MSDVSWTDNMPAMYDAGLGPALFQPYAEHLAGLAGALQPRRVLEVAAGTGLVTRQLVRALPEAQVTATDLNDAMVGYGGSQVPDATWSQADAQDLPFDDGSFDLVVCQYGVMFFPDKPGAFAQMARVLRPGGSALLAIWDSTDGNDFAQAVVEGLAVALPDDPPSFLQRVPYGYGDPDRITADLVAGGLTPVSVDRVVLPGRADSARTVAEGFCLGSPLRFELQERGEPDVIAAQVAAEVEARLGSGALEGSLAAYVVTATAP